jgi:hypothetical protein
MMAGILAGGLEKSAGISSAGVCICRLENQQNSGERLNGSGNNRRQRERESRVPVEAGQQLLHYRIVEKLGEGGM